MTVIHTEDTKILDEIIYGRVEPHIYAFVTNTIPNYLKVGDTYRPLCIRLKEWREHYSDLVEKFDCEAKIGGDYYFRDYAVHKYLEDDLGKQRLLPESIADGVYYSKEFFENATEEDVQLAIKDIKECFDAHKDKYTFYGLSTLRPEEYHFVRDSKPLKTRPNQSEAIEKFKSALLKGRKNLLMYAVMRFGKTFTAMCCAKEMNAKVVVVVSAKADVAIEWKKTVEKTANFEGYSYIDSQQLKNNERLISDTLGAGKKIVVFLTLQDLQGEMIKERHEEIFATDIDLLIIDETHFAARAEKYGAVLRVTKNQLKQAEAEDDSGIFEDYHEEITKQLDAKVRLHLSGTPYRILMGSEFTDDDIIAFCQFTDIMDAKEAWDKQYLENERIDKCTGKSKINEEWDNPYYGFPQMVRFAFNPTKSAREKLKELKNCGIGYDLSSLFETKSLAKTNTEHNLFKFENEVLDLLKAIDGSKQEKGILPFLDYAKIKDGNMCRHIVFVLPYCASCDAMQKLLSEHVNEFDYLSEYEIINIAGFNERNLYPTVESIRDKIKACESNNKKTITLTVNRMLTGSTVEEWDTMLYLKNSSSPQEYDQAIFRLQNQYIKTYTGDNGKEIKFNMKPQTLLVDFDPTRMFYLQEWRSQIYNANTDERGNNRLAERIAKELSISPIIYYNREKLARVQATDVMAAVRKYSNERSVLDEVYEIPADFSLLDYEEIAQVIREQAELGSKEGLKVKPHDGEETDVDTPKNPELPDDNETEYGNNSDTDSRKQEDENKKIEKQFHTYYARILFYAYLTNSEVKSLKDIAQSILESTDNTRIAKNLNLNNDVLSIILAKMDKFILRKLDYKIENINTLANDDNMSLLERAEVATNKFDRYSDSEIRTPIKIAYDMVTLLPEKALKELLDKQERVLDIASKSGEFAIAMYKLLINKGYSIEQFGDLIYSIPTSSVAYEFTRKTYDIMGLNKDNIAALFTSYNLLPSTKPCGRNISQHSLKITNVLTRKGKFSGINLDIDDSSVKEENKMKFSAILGNPPYHEASISTSDKPIYNMFVDLAYAMSDKVILITPARFLFNAGKTPKSWNKKMLLDKHLCVSLYERNSAVIFPNTDIKGGVVVTYRDCTKIFGAIENFVPNSLLRSILSKVRSDANFHSISCIINATECFKLSQTLHNENPAVIEYMSKGHEFDLTSNILNKIRDVFFVEKPKNSEKYLRVCGRQGKARVYRWVKAAYIKENNGVGKYKVVIPESNNDGTFGETLVMPFVADRDVVTTQTFITLGFTENRLIAQAILKYICGKFARALLGTLKITQHNKRETWNNVPMQDFTEKSDIDWSKSVGEIDQMLYRKYNLTQEQIDFIENNVKPM